MAKVSASVKWNQRAIADVKKRVAQGLISMGYDVATRARYKVPVLTGNLQGTIRVEPHMNQWQVYVCAGGIDGVRYGRRREFENNAHPWKRFYMQTSLENVISGNYLKHFKGRL